MDDVRFDFLMVSRRRIRQWHALQTQPLNWSFTAPAHYTHLFLLEHVIFVWGSVFLFL